MTTALSQASETQQTEHPYIVRVPDICGSRPTIKGTRISVQHIATLYKAGDTVEEILQAHPHLQAAAVHDAISYYLVCGSREGGEMRVSYFHSGRYRP